MVSSPAPSSSKRPSYASCRPCASAGRASNGTTLRVRTGGRPGSTPGGAERPASSLCCRPPARVCKRKCAAEQQRSQPEHLSHCALGRWPCAAPPPAGARPDGDTAVLLPPAAPAEAPLGASSSMPAPPPCRPSPAGVPGEQTPAKRPPAPTTKSASSARTSAGSSAPARPPLCAWRRHDPRPRPTHRWRLLADHAAAGRPPPPWGSPAPPRWRCRRQAAWACWRAWCTGCARRPACARPRGPGWTGAPPAAQGPHSACSARQASDANPWRPPARSPAPTPVLLSPRGSMQCARARAWLHTRAGPHRTPGSKRPGTLPCSRRARSRATPAGPARTACCAQVSRSVVVPDTTRLMPVPTHTTASHHTTRCMGA